MDEVEVERHLDRLFGLVIVCTVMVCVTAIVCAWILH